MHRAVRHGGMTQRNLCSVPAALLEVLEARRLLSDTTLTSPTSTTTTTSITTTKQTWTVPTRTQGVVSSTVASTSSMPASESVTVSAAGRAHTLTLTWLGVDGATNYLV